MGVCDGVRWWALAQGGGIPQVPVGLSQITR